MDRLTDERLRELVEWNAFLEDAMEWEATERDWQSMATELLELRKDNERLHQTIEHGEHYTEQIERELDEQITTVRTQVDLVQRLQGILDLECKVLGHEYKLGCCRIEGGVKTSKCFRCGHTKKEEIANPENEDGVYCWNLSADEMDADRVFVPPDRKPE